MNNINSLIIEGNMVREPVGKTTAKGTKLCTFSIGTNRSLKNAAGEQVKEVSYFDVETWGKLAEVCEAKGGKGKGVRIVGRVKQSRWEGSDGKKYSRISIVAEHVEFKPSYAEKDDEQVESLSVKIEKERECVEEENPVCEEVVF